MGTRSAADIDFIEELKLRRWARENYVARPERERAWHPIIHDEMGRKDREHRADGHGVAAATA